jgi:hypothetical protein
LALIVNQIGLTKIGGGNKVECVIDRHKYKCGVEISDKEFDAIKVKDHRHSRWLEEAPLKGAFVRGSIKPSFLI